MLIRLTTFIEDIKRARRLPEPSPNVCEALLKRVDFFLPATAAGGALVDNLVAMVASTGARRLDRLSSLPLNMENIGATALAAAVRNDCLSAAARDRRSPLDVDLRSPAALNMSQIGATTLVALFCNEDFLSADFAGGGFNRIAGEPPELCLSTAGSKAGLASCRNESRSSDSTSSPSCIEERRFASKELLLRRTGTAPLLPSIAPHGACRESRRDGQPQNAGVGKLRLRHKKEGGRPSVSKTERFGHVAGQFEQVTSKGPWAKVACVRMIT